MCASPSSARLLLHGSVAWVEIAAEAELPSARLSRAGSGLVGSSARVPCVTSWVLLCWDLAWGEVLSTGMASFHLAACSDSPSEGIVCKTHPQFLGVTKLYFAFVALN